MRMIKEEGYREGEWKYFWVNDQVMIVSPAFPKKTLAVECNTMHEEWMEEPRPPVFAPEEK